MNVEIIKTHLTRIEELREAVVDTAAALVGRCDTDEFRYLLEQLRKDVKRLDLEKESIAALYRDAKEAGDNG